MILLFCKIGNNEIIAFFFTYKIPAGFSYMVDVEVSETECLLQEDFDPHTCQPQARSTEKWRWFSLCISFPFWWTMIMMMLKMIMMMVVKMMIMMMGIDWQTILLSLREKGMRNQSLTPKHVLHFWSFFTIMIWDCFKSSLRGPNPKKRRQLLKNWKIISCFT